MSSSADGACGGQPPSSSGLGTRTRTHARTHARHVSTRAVANNESATDSISSHVAAGLSPSQLASILSRPRIDFSSILTTVSPIVESVRASGDEAVRSYTAEFDRVNLPATSPVCVPIDDASLGGCEGLEEAVVRAFDVAYGNIKAFHEAQKGSGEVVVETMKGVVCRRVGRAIGSVGLYVPGGSAVLPSTALMLAVPAGIAGCKTIVLATPPRQDGMYCYSGRAASEFQRAGGELHPSFSEPEASCIRVSASRRLASFTRSEPQASCVRVSASRRLASFNHSEPQEAR